MLAIGLLALTLLAYSLGLYNTVRGSISAFNEDCTNNNTLATTSISWQTAGTATSTVECIVGYGLAAAQEAVVLVQINASSTDTTYLFYAEEANNASDWYPIIMTENTTTTPNIRLTKDGAWQYKFASTTVGGANIGRGILGYNGTNNRDNLSFNVPVRMKRVRVYATVASSTTGSNGAGSGGVWMQILPKVEQ